MSSNAESHSQVIEVVEKRPIALLLLVSPLLLRKQFKHFYLAQIALRDGGKD